MAKAAKKAVIASATESLEEGEVSLSSVKPAEEKGLSNGLGLEKFIPAAPTTTTKSKATKDTADETDADEHDSTQDQSAEKTDTKDQADDKKVVPAKDPKTGRFLPKVTAASDPPVEDAKADDDLDTLKKRLKDTRDWASQVNKKNQELDVLVKKLTDEQAILAQKLSGTYVEPEQPATDPVEVAKLVERAKISRGIAEQLYGKDVVQKMIYDENSPYRQLEQADPIVKARVFQADQPVIEAFKQLKWKTFTDQYGDDPDTIVERLTTEIQAEFVKNLKEKGRQKRTIEDVSGLHDVGGSGEETHVSNEKTVPSTVNLRTVFPGFPTGSF